MHKVKTIKPIKKLRKRLIRVSALLLLLVVLFLAGISTPFVQTYLGKKITNTLNKNYSTSISVSNINIGILGNVVLNDVFIADHRSDTLLYAKSVTTSLKDFKNIKAGKLAFKSLAFDGLYFMMKTYKNEQKSNLSVFVNKFSSKKDTDSTSVFKLTSNNIGVNSGKLKILNENANTSEIINLRELSLLGKKLIIDSSQVAVSITSGSFKERRGLSVLNLQTAFRYTPMSIGLESLIIATNNTVINADLLFSASSSGYSNFLNSVQVSGNFNESTISYKDVNLFYNEFGTDKVKFSTSISGTLNDLLLSDLSLQSNKNTTINGDFLFKNSFSKQKNAFELHANFSELTTVYKDLRLLLPKSLKNTIPSIFENIGNFSLSGKTTVTTKKIDVDLDLRSDIGAVSTKMSLSDVKDIDVAAYQGTAIFKNVDFGKLFKDPVFGKVSFIAKVKGKGFSLDKINSFIDGNVSSATINNYAYKNIVVSGNMQKKVFKGKFSVADKNANINFEGLVNMSSKINEYDFKAVLADVDLNAINLVKKDSVSVFSGVVEMNMKGTGINDAFGEIKLKNARYKNALQTVEFSDSYLKSSFNKENVRLIELSSPGSVSGRLNGTFKFEELGRIIKNDLGSVYANYKPIKVSNGQYVDFNVKLENKLTEVFFPEVSISEKMTLKGTLSNNEEDFNVLIKTPEVSYKSATFKGVSVRLNNSNPLFNTYVSAKEVNAKSYVISDFNLVNKTINDTLFFRSEFKGGTESKDTYKLNMYHTVNTSGQSVFGVKKSNLHVRGYDWKVNAENNASTIVFDSDFKNITINKFKVSHKDEFVALSGVINGSSEKNINLEFGQVGLLKLFKTSARFNCEGRVNGLINIFQKNNVYVPSGAVKIDNLKINKLALGDLSLGVVANGVKKYTIKSSLVKYGDTTLLLDGILDFVPETPYLETDITFRNQNLSFLTALGGNVITDIRGLVSGKAVLFGDYNNPDFQGELFLDEAGLKIPYLNVDFDFENNALLSLKNRQFQFNNIAILDTKHFTSGRLNGFAAHESFKYWSLGLEVSTNNLLILDKKKEEESLYYGTAFIDGLLNVTGPTNELLVSLSATTNKGTVFKIPIKDASAVGDNSFIKTMSVTESNRLAANPQIIAKELSGLELELDLNITPDAAIEIVLDQESGSVLKGTGAGDIRVEINTNDKFNIFGDFVVDKGTYNFVYGSNFLQGGVIEKRFNVKSGGTINWDGDPYEAQLNMSAVYSAIANPALLLDNPSVNRKIPVDVVISLSGGLMQPDVNFDIQFPKTNSVVRSELLYKLNDKEFRDKQALSLVTSGQFTSAYAYGQTAVTGNLVERATALVNDILSQEDDKFKIGLNYEQGENNPLEEQRIEDRFGFTISTQISDRILINGKVGIPVGGVNKTIVAGDVQVEFLLNEDGTLRAKVFNRENDLTTSVATNEIGYTQGGGISYKVSFDDFEELMQKIFKRKSKKVQSEK